MRAELIRSLTYQPTHQNVILSKTLESIPDKIMILDTGISSALNCRKCHLDYKKLVHTKISQQLMDLWMNTYPLSNHGLLLKQDLPIFSIYVSTT